MITALSEFIPRGNPRVRLTLIGTVLRGQYTTRKQGHFWGELTLHRLEDTSR